MLGEYIMNDSKQMDFVDGKLYKALNFIYWITMSSTLFMISNILLIFAIYAILINSNGSPINIYHFITVGVLALPIGPSLTGLYTVMDKVIKNSDVSVIRDYFAGYRRHLGSSIIISFIIVLISVVAVINYHILSQSDTLGFLLLPLLAMLSLLLCVTLYVFPLLTIKKRKVIEVFKLSLYFAIREFKVTLFLLLSFVVSVYLMLLLPTMLTFILPGTFCIVTSYILQAVYKKVI